MKRALPLVIALLVFASCGKKDSPTGPSNPAQTRIINVSGDLAFGNVDIGQSKQKTFTITNSGTSVLTFTGFTAVGGTGTAGFSASPLSGTVPAGGNQVITVTFRPVEAKFYGNALTVTADHTSGNNALNANGTGVNNNPIFTMAGNGDTVFDMPTYVARVKIVADYTKNSSNWIVRIGGKLTVNELIGTGWGQTHLEGTYLTTGGIVEITNSSGVAWSFTEVR